MSIKQNVPSEHAEQVTFLAQFEKNYPGVRVFAIPNGGFRNKSVAVKLKAEGVKKGVPDLCIPEWNLWIEMKRKKGGRLTPEQKDWISYLKKCGHTVIVAPGWEAAMEALECYIIQTTQSG